MRTRLWLVSLAAALAALLAASPAALAARYEVELVSLSQSFHSTSESGEIKVTVTLQGAKTTIPGLSRPAAIRGSLGMAGQIYVKGRYSGYARGDEACSSCGRIGNAALGDVPITFDTLRDPAGTDENTKDAIALSGTVPGADDCAPMKAGLIIISQAVSGGAGAPGIQPWKGESPPASECPPDAAEDPEWAAACFGIQDHRNPYSIGNLTSAQNQRLRAATTAASCLPVMWCANLPRASVARLTVGQALTVSSAYSKWVDTSLDEPPQTTTTSSRWTLRVTRVS